MKEKVIKLGIERGYIPANAYDNVEEKFAIQYERLVEEIGEAFRELRLRNKENFDNEYGDVIVLYTNCRYIVNKYADAKEYVRMMDTVIDLIKIMERRASYLFQRDYTSYEAYDRCLKLAYDKILARGGMLIGGDWFKPSDREYQEAKLKELELEYEVLVDSPKAEGYVGKLKELYFKLKKLDDSSLDDDSISRIVFLETSVYGMLNNL